MASIAANLPNGVTGTGARTLFRLLMVEMGRFADSPRKLVLGFKVPVATTLETRLLGLAFLDPSEAGEGLLIPNCRRVHTFGMRFPLDVLFLDDEARVIDLRRGLPPRRFAACRAGTAVLELPSPVDAR